MKKASAPHTKFTGLLVLTALLLAPIATPTVADAQRAGTQATRPTASITVNGGQNTTVETGGRAPVVRWNSKNGTTHKTTLKVNNVATCGVRNGQVWGSGKNAQGSANAPAPSKAREGCVLTFTYEVTNRLGQKSSDTAVVRYVAAKPAPTKPKPTIINPGTGTNTGTGTSTSTSQTLKLLTPNGGEKWMLNSNTTIITWTPEPHADGMVAYLEKKNGNSFQTVGKIVEARKGSIQWFGEIEVNGTVQYATPGDGYYIRIVDTKTGATDRSDKPFTIIAIDAFNVNLQPADENNYLEIKNAGPVRLTWDARTPGITNISCTLTLYDNHGNTVETKSVATTGMYEAYAELPDPSRNNDNSYTFAYLGCDSSVGHRGDYIGIFSHTVTTKPSIKINNITKDAVAPGDNIAYTFSGTNLNVPSNVRVELYSPVYAYPSAPVVYGNIGEATFTRQSEYGSLYAPKEFGDYRLTICDDNTPNPEVPFKPLCAHSDYFKVGTGTTIPSDITVTGVSKNAMVDFAEFPGDIEKGIYEIEVDVAAGDKDIFIPTFKDMQAFTYQITDMGVPFTGTTTSYITKSSATYVDGWGLTNRYYIPKNTTKTFTLRVELDPVGTASSHQYGIRLSQLNYGHSTSTVDKVYTFPSAPEFETNKITIASAVPAGTITQTVAQGAAGEDVSRVQAALKKAGLFNEEITGYFGSITRAAVKAFQREHALENVGAVGPRTMSLMNQLLSK